MVTISIIIDCVNTVAIEFMYAGTSMIWPISKRMRSASTSHLTKLSSWVALAVNFHLDSIHAELTVVVHDFRRVTNAGLPTKETNRGNAICRDRNSPCILAHNTQRGGALSKSIDIAGNHRRRSRPSQSSLSDLGGDAFTYRAAQPMWINGGAGGAATYRRNMSMCARNVS